jgi:hypothetical protein
MLNTEAGFSAKAAPPVETHDQSSAWSKGLVNGHGRIPDEIHARSDEVARDDLRAKKANGAEEMWPPGMQIVNPHLAISLRAQGLLQPSNFFGYIHLAAEVERPHALRRTGPEKKALLEKLKAAAKKLLADEVVINRVDVFNAFIIPPGSKEGRRVLEKEQYDVHVAEFDIVVLVECVNEAAARRVRASASFAALKALLDAQAKFVHCVTAKNPKRIAEVDKTRDGVFLFNYFFSAGAAGEGAAGIDILLAVWEYTAGWWTEKANLTNSTPLQPLPGERSEYSLINHCRWNRPIDILPHLIFRPSLGEFVLKNFTANNILAMPILYRLA